MLSELAALRPGFFVADSGEGEVLESGWKLGYL